MHSILIFVLGLFVIQTMLPSALRYFGPGSDLSKIGDALGPRDSSPTLSVVGTRAERALRNMQEALPVFLTLGLLNIVLNTTTGTATNGGWLFLLARLLYVPAYLSGVPFVRSAIWVTSWVGLAMMLSPLIGGIHISP